MDRPDHHELLDATRDLSLDWLDSLPDRPVFPEEPEVGGGLRRELTDSGVDPVEVIRDLSREAGPGLVASPGPRYFGFVVGGAHPSALAADWLVSAWDQMAGAWVGSPASAVIEEITSGWVLDLLDLPLGSSVGFTTGATMAGLTGLAAGRHAVISRSGYDIERAGLHGVPPLTIVAGDQRHSTVDVALRLLGIGTDQVTEVPSDDQGRVDPGAFEQALDEAEGPVIAIGQAGNVATGASDPLEEMAESAARHAAWLHIDGAFGLWARTVPDLAPQVAGAELADSWSVDAHKWLNVPYDCGLVIVKEPAAHHAAIRKGGSYAMSSGDGNRDGEQWVPEFSRRARATPVYAVLRTLGRDGVAAMIAEGCSHARRFAGQVDGVAGMRVLNEVVLNQVLIGFGSGNDEATDRAARIVEAIESDGTFWAGTTDFSGRLCLRISVTGWATRAEDVDRSAEALIRLAEADSDA